MRRTLILALLGGLIFAQEPAKPSKAKSGPGGKKDEVNEEIVKKVREFVSAKADGRKALLDELLAREDLDWPSVKKGLETGRYYQQPIATEFGKRDSRMVGATWTGAKDKRARAFSWYVPKGYDHEKKIPMLIYLHHNAQGAATMPMKGSAAMPPFRKLCDD